MAEGIKVYGKEEQGIFLSTKVGKFLFALCFPGDYSLGMANLGYQSIIRLLVPLSGEERGFSVTEDRSH